ncbi:MAG TPA: 2-dehydropantoate 2-reductase N-terminal domain-containing protein [Streptosporangiaceae bacterium]
MRYIVIGPGGVGGAIGGLLARAGHDVVLVARGAHLEALRSGGLTVATPTETFTVRPVVAAGPDDLTLTAGDAVLLAVKSQDTAVVLDQWSYRPVWSASATAGQAAEGTAAQCVPVFCVQNGVANEPVAARRFARVYGVGVQMPAELLGPGQVVAPGSPVAGQLEIGRYPAGSGPAGERLAADLSASGFIARVTDDVMVAKYTKLLRNLRNAILAACGSMRSDAARTLAGMAVSEAEACFEAAGIRHLGLAAANAAREDVVQELPVNGRIRGGGSTWQSLNRRSGSTEVDYLNGEIVLLGRQHGVPTPVNELLQVTVGVLAARREAPGTVDPEDLLARALRAQGTR